MRSVLGELNYLGPMSSPPVFHGPDAPGNNLVYDAKALDIADARTLPQSPALDCEGFSLVPHRSSLHGLEDEPTRAVEYGHEVTALIKTLTGATSALLMSILFRSAKKTMPGNPARSSLPPARFVHWDYTDLSAHTVFLPRLLAKTPLKRYRRVTVYQTWRVLSAPPQDVPLTVADGRTVRQQDLVTCRMPTATSTAHRASADAGWSEFSLCRFSPKHRWYYYPNMQPDELLVFKGYEYDPTRQLRVIHTAFDDLSSGPNAPPRRNVEARIAAFFA